MSDDALVTIDLDGFVAFYAAIAVLVGLVYWLNQRREQRARKQYFDQFQQSQLRMSPYKVGLVYQIIAVKEDEVTVIPVWDGKTKVINGNEQRFAPNRLVPFDNSRFF